METLLIIVTVVLVLVTASYKLIPHRLVGPKKPRLALYPKYRKRLPHNLSEEEVQSTMSGLGFKPERHTDTMVMFTRGSIFGDFSIRLAKILVKVHKRNVDEYELTVEAGWLVAFDTGDLWTLTTELSDKLENPEGHILPSH